MLRFHVSTDFILLFIVCSRTLCAQRTYPYHVSSFRATFTCYWIAYYLYVSFPVSHVSLLVPIWIVDSSMNYHSVLRLLPLSRRLICRVIIPGLMTCLPLMTVCTCIYLPGIYTVGDGDSSLIFNLLCNHPTSVTCEIPRTLLVPSSSLAKATALQSLGGTSPFSVSRLPVVKSSLRMYFGALITED